MAVPKNIVFIFSVLLRVRVISSQNQTFEFESLIYIFSK